MKSILHKTSSVATPQHINFLPPAKGNPETTMAVVHTRYPCLKNDDADADADEDEESDDEDEEDTQVDLPWFIPF